MIKILISLLFFLNSIALGMEAIETVLFEDVEGTVVEFPKKEALKFGLIRKWEESIKDIPKDDSEKFSLYDVPFFTKNNLEVLFVFVEDVKRLEEVSHIESIKDIFLLADVLEAPFEVTKKLVHKAWDTLPLKELNCSFYTYLNSIYTVYKNIRARDNKLKITNMNLHILDGIDKLSSKKITTIILSHNCLRTIDLKYIVDLFPSLKRLFVDHNKLEKIKMPVCLPKNFSLKASHNSLVKIPVYKTGENCKLDFTKNPLSKCSKDIIDRSIQLGYSQKLCNFLYLLKFNDYFFNLLIRNLMIAGMGVAMLSGSITLPIKFKYPVLFGNIPNYANPYIESITPSDQDIKNMVFVTKQIMPFGLGLGILCSMYQAGLPITFDTSRSYKISQVYYDK